MTGRVKAGCDTVLDRVGRWMARRLTTPVEDLPVCAPSDLQTLQQTLRVGDVVLVEGREYISSAIKYLTQSTWSHAALFVGDLMPGDGRAERLRLVEVTLGEGCIAVPLSKYCLYNLRICRPHRLSLCDRKRVASFMINRIGTRYDHRNIVDLARYFFPTPPVPVRWRRRMLALGSGDPTRAICSSMIARAFQSVRYPILPEIRKADDGGGGEIYHIRHHSLFVPRDFDLSPYFGIVKPELTSFDPQRIHWAAGTPPLTVSPPAPRIRQSAASQWLKCCTAALYMGE